MASWKGGIAIYAQDGAEALEAWLLDRSVRNVQALNAVVACGAKPWPSVYGGLENIRIVE